MKRPLLIIGICLLLGAVVNVAVAWGCAVLSARELASADVPHDAPNVITIGHIGMGVHDNVYLRTSEPVPESSVKQFVQALSITIDIGDPGAARLTNVATAIETQAGWPMRAMTGRRIRRKPLSSVSTPSVIGAIEVTRTVEGVGRLRLVPLQPLWPGFAVNTLFYAALLWLLITGSVALRRFRRLKRGLCPKCAYPIGESSVCTECGRELRAKTT